MTHQQVPAGVAETPLPCGLLPHVPVVDDRQLVAHELGDRADVAVDVGDDAYADLVGDLAQRVDVHGPAVDGAVGLGGEGRDALRPAGDAEVVDAGVVEQRADQLDVELGRLAHGRLHGGVLLDRLPDRVAVGADDPLAGRRLVPGGQRGRDDVAGGQVAVGRGVLRPSLREQGDVRTDDRVDLVLGPAELGLGGRGLDQAHEPVPGVVVGQPQCGRGALQPFEPAHQLAQRRLQVRERAAGLVLVLQRPAEPEQRDRRGVRVDLDRAPWPGRGRVDVEPEGVGHLPPPGAVGELPLAGVRGVRSRVEAGEVPVERGLAGPVAGGVLDHERCVDADEARPVGVRRQGRKHRRVVGCCRHVHEGALVVEDRDATEVALTPGEVDADEVHGPQATGSSRARNARVRSQASAEADGWWSAKSELSKAWLAPS